jgi:hypothetical protein
MGLPLSQRWSVIRDNDLCEYCVRHRRGPVCHNLKALKELRCTAPGCGENHPRILHPDPVIVHHLGYRWIKQEATRPDKESRANKKISGNGRSLCKIILEPAGTEPVSEDEFDFGPDGGEEVNEAASETNSRSSESSNEEETSGSEAGVPEDESSDEESHFNSEDKLENPDNDYRKMLSLRQTVTVFDKKLNVCFDRGFTVSVISQSADIPYIFKNVKEDGIARWWEGCV